MAIAVSDFLSGVRYRINDTDTNNPEYSDAELLKYLRTAMRLLSLALAAEEWRGILKRSSVSLSDGASVLPVDFIKEYYVLDRVGNELRYSDDGSDVGAGYYSIVGNEIYAQQDASPLVLVYFAVYPDAQLDGNLPCPDWMEPYLSAVVAYMALNRNEFALSSESAMIKDAAAQIAGNLGTYGNRDANDSGLYEVPW